MLLNITHSLLIAIGFCGFSVETRSSLRLLYVIEICMLGLNLTTLSGSIVASDTAGLIFVLGMLAIAAVESAVGLAIIVASFRVVTSPSASNLSQLHG
jgi:NADH-quinone oxidoreductase subunit K